MPKPMPISEAVQKAIDEHQGLKLKIDLRDVRDGCSGLDMEYARTKSQYVSAKFRLVQLGESKRSKASYTTPADAANALRAIADQLDPDVHGKALEIAGGLVGEVIFMTDGWQRRFLRIIGALFQPDKFKADKLLEMIDGYLRALPIYRRDYMQQARDFFAEQQPEESTKDG